MYDKDRPILDSKTHSYRLPSQPDLRLMSVTQLVKAFSRPFDAPLEAERYANKHGLKKDEVLAGWREKGRRAASLGTIVHRDAEILAANFAVHGHSNLGQGVHYHGISGGIERFYRDHPEAALAGPIAELPVAMADFRIAGTIDLITSLDGGLAVLDFKTSEKLDMFGYGGQKLYAPFNKLPQSNYWTYVIQLSIYAYILTHVHESAPDHLGIIWLRPDGSYQLKKVERIPDETIEKALRKNLNRLKKEDKANER